MADTVSQNITLTATGGDQVAQTFNMVKGSMSTVVAGHDEMKAKFSERFEHIGLKVFAGDLLRTSGLAGEARPIIGTLMMSINSLAGAFGLAGGPVLLFVAAGAALVGIVGKIIDSHKEELEILTKLDEEQQKLIKSTDDEIKSIKDYGDALGKLPASLQKVLDAEIALRNVRMANEQHTIQEALPNLNKKVAAEKEDVASIEKQIDVTKQHIVALGVLKEGMQGYGLLQDEEQAMTKLQAAYGKKQEALKSDQATLDKYEQRMIELHAGETRSLQERTKEIVDSDKEDARITAQEDERHKQLNDHLIRYVQQQSDAQKKENDAAVDSSQKAADHMNMIAQKYNQNIQIKDNDTFVKKNQHLQQWQAQQTAALNTEYQADVAYANASIMNEQARLDALKNLRIAHENAITQLHAETNSKMETLDDMLWTKYKTSMNAALDSAAHAMGAGIAQMVVEGKNFSQVFSQIMVQMAEKFIENVIAMIIEWAMLQAVMDVFPGGAQAYQGVANASYPALAQASYDNLGAMADGGTFYANKPTLAIFGEAGPEMATFTPMSGGTTSASGQQQGGNGSASIGAVNITLNVDKMDGNDPSTTLHQLSEAIRRETSAGRQFANTVAGIAGRNAKQAY